MPLAAALNGTVHLQGYTLNTLHAYARSSTPDKAQRIPEAFYVLRTETGRK